MIAEIKVGLQIIQQTLLERRIFMITNTLSISKEKNKENTEKRRQDIKLKICTYIAYFFIILVMLSLIDLVRTAAKSPSSFELVNETD